MSTLSVIFVSISQILTLTTSPHHYSGFLLLSWVILQLKHFSYLQTAKLSLQTRKTQCLVGLTSGFLYFYTSVIQLLSISSTFYACIFCTKVFSLLRVWLWTNFRTKNARVRCWWNWMLVSWKFYIFIFVFLSPMLFQLFYRHSY